jgi:hypothetical protein
MTLSDEATNKRGKQRTHEDSSGEHSDGLPT